jgi:hypothetical protein
MKLLDIYLVNDQMWMIVKSILFMLSAVAAVTSVVFYVKRKARYDFSKVSVISILAVSMSFLSLALIVGQPVSLESQISKVSNINLLESKIDFKIENGDNVSYRFDRSTSKYSSTDNAFIEGLNEIMGRYDFTYVKKIRKVGKNQWDITFKCDCGRVKSVVIGK